MRSATAADPLAALADRGGELDLAALFQAIWRKKYWILVPTVLVLVGTLGVLSIIPPKYRSETRLFLESQETSFTRPTSEQAGKELTLIDEQAVQSQVQLVMSRDLALAAVKKLDLANNPEFDPLQQGLGPAKRILLTLGLIKDPFSKTPEERVLENYYEALSSYAVEKSRIIAIEFKSEDAELAARAANTIAALYIEAQSTAKRSESLDASTALSPQIEDLRKRVEMAENAVEKYRTENGLFISQNNASLTQQQLSEVNTQLSNARAQQSDSASKAKLLRALVRSGRPTDVSDVTNNELIRRLVEQRVNLRAQLALESRNLLPGHPRIKELNAQISGLENQITGEAEKAIRSLENDAQIAGARLAALEAQLVTQKNAAATSNEQEVQLRVLEREAKAQRDLLEAYLARYREASARGALEALPADARIVSSAAVANTPYFPKKIPIAFISTFATLILSIALIATGELLSGRAFAPVRREDETGPLPSSGMGPLDVAAYDPRLMPYAMQAPMPMTMPGMDNPGMARSMGRLADRVFGPASRLSSVAARRVLFTAGKHGAGTTTAATEFARTLAAGGSRVVLVDIDAGRATAKAAGLGELLAGRSSFAQVIHRDRMSRVHVIPGGAALTGLDPDTVSTRMGVVFDALSSTYDAVIFDAPPMGCETLGIPPSAIAAACDATVLITNSAKDTATTAHFQALRDLGAMDVSVVVTRGVPDPDQSINTQQAAA